MTADVQPVVTTTKTYICLGKTRKSARLTEKKITQGQSTSSSYDDTIDEIPRQQIGRVNSIVRNSAGNYFCNFEFHTYIFQ